MYGLQSCKCASILILAYGVLLRGITMEDNANSSVIITDLIMIIVENLSELVHFVLCFQTFA